MIRLHDTTFQKGKKVNPLLPNPPPIFLYTHPKAIRGIFFEAGAYFGVSFSFPTPTLRSWYISNAAIPWSTETIEFIMFTFSSF